MEEDQKTADQLMDAVLMLMAGGPEGTVGAKALLREIRDRDPRALEAAAAGITLRRLGLKTPTNRLAV